MEKDRGKFCCKPRVFTRFRANDEDDDESDISQINTVHVLPAYYVKINFNIILKSKPIIS